MLDNEGLACLNSGWIRASDYGWVVAFDFGDTASITRKRRISVQTSGEGIHVALDRTP
jgi:hypothetical protein